MTDCYYDALRAQGEYPRKGYGWQSEAEQRDEIARKVAQGWREPWVMREAKRFGIDVPNEG
ncbi:hypothetical protein [Paraburkholderia sp. J11-2]|uniref:hypothetical protein n=1 Tax=Paraburkholderia sp. J11-2 TaxID=2805431 RepID=UPI002AB6A369|nr:hypothetical protein [Paraburkholderia sp. J11-2]